MAGDAGGVRDLDLPSDGAEFHAAAALKSLDAIERLFDTAYPAAGIRLPTFTGLKELLGPCSQIGSLVARHLGPDARPVRAIAFDKAAGNNWSLGWHQDRTICVSERKNIDGFGPWTVKQGLAHVQPPFPLLESMITARIHLDKVDEDNAPLRIALGSHRQGLIGEDRIAEVVELLEEYTCLADPGDVWLYATPILHASDRSISDATRRVLQVDYCAQDIPAGLEWLPL